MVAFQNIYSHSHTHTLHLRTRMVGYIEAIYRNFITSVYSNLGFLNAMSLASQDATDSIERFVNDKLEDTL